MEAEILGERVEDLDVEGFNWSSNTFTGDFTASSVAWSAGNSVRNVEHRSTSNGNLPTATVREAEKRRPNDATFGRALTRGFVWRVITRRIHR